MALGDTMVIESSQNKIIKLVKALQTKKEREKQKLFVAEGARFVSEATEGCQFFLLSESFAATADVAQYEKKAPVYLTKDALFETVTETEHAQGVLAVVKQPVFDCNEVIAKAGERGFFVLAEAMQDPGNLGTLIRTAAACGVQGVFLTKGTVDVYNPKVLRSTMGAIFHVPVVRDVSAKDTISLLQQAGIAVYAAHLKGEGFPYDLPLQKGCCFAIGNEANGLQEETAALCNTLVKIPMPGQTESLNASVAAAVLMYEVVRQRI